MYGPGRKVVWQGSAGDPGPYADQVGLGVITTPSGVFQGEADSADLVGTVPLLTVLTFACTAQRGVRFWTW